MDEIQLSSLAVFSLSLNNLDKIDTRVAVRDLCWGMGHGSAGVAVAWSWQTGGLYLSYDLHLSRAFSPPQRPQRRRRNTAQQRNCVAL